MPGEVGVGIDQSAVVAGELVAVLLRECLVLDGDEVLVVPVQDQDVQIAPLFVDVPPPLPEGLGGTPIGVEKAGWGHCGVEQGGDEVPGLLVVRRWIQKPSDDPGVKCLVGPAARGDKIEGVHLLTFLGDGWPRLVRVSRRFAE